MAAYFNRNLRLLRQFFNKRRGRTISFDYLATMLGFPSIKLQHWERDGMPTLAELKKLAQKYSELLDIELTVDQLANRDLRYDDRFRDIAWKSNSQKIDL